MYDVCIPSLPTQLCIAFSLWFARSSLLLEHACDTASVVVVVFLSKRKIEQGDSSKHTASLYV